MLPARTGNNPDTVRSSVVLPAPFEPTMQAMPAAAMRRLTPHSTCTLP